MISLLRVDNRLIHGQVATGWISKSGASKIVVIDDKSAANEMLRDVLELATPPRDRAGGLLRRAGGGRLEAGRIWRRQGDGHLQVHPRCV